MVLINPPDPVLESIDGDNYYLRDDFVVKFGFWMRQLQFSIPRGFKTDLASIPWYLRWWRDRAAFGILAPIVHDYLCKQRGEIKNLQGDDLFLHWFDCHLYFLVAMRLDGVPWNMALLAFIGLIIGGPRWVSR